MNDLVGAIVPCYKQAHLLQECLGSLASQTMILSRIVVIDDCSPDGEEQRRLCREFDVEYIRNKENLGLSEARNTGYVALDDTEYIFSLDADDWLAPGYVKLCVEALEEHPAAWVAYPDCQLFGFESRVWDQPDYDPERLARINYIVCASMWRSRAWKMVKNANGYGYDPHMRKLGGWEDYLFNMEALLGIRGGDKDAAIHAGHHKYWFLYRRHQATSMAGAAWNNRYEIRRYMEHKMWSLYERRLPNDWERFYM